MLGIRHTNIKTRSKTQFFNKFKGLSNIDSEFLLKVLKEVGIGFNRNANLLITYHFITWSFVHSTIKESTNIIKAIHWTKIIQTCGLSYTSVICLLFAINVCQQPIYLNGIEDDIKQLYPMCV